MIQKKIQKTLNAPFTTLLLCDPEYKMLRKRSTYTSEDVSKLLRGIQLDQDTIEKKKQRSKKDVQPAQIDKKNTTKVANTTVSPISTFQDTDFARRMKQGICHLCKKQGHIRPNCPDLAKHLEMQAANIAAQLTALNDTLKVKHSIDYPTDRPTYVDQQPELVGRSGNKTVTLFSLLQTIEPPEALADDNPILRTGRRVSRPQETSRELNTVNSAVSVTRHASEKMAITTEKIGTLSYPFLLDLGANCNLMDPAVATK